MVRHSVIAFCSFTVFTASMQLRTKVSELIEFWGQKNKGQRQQHMVTRTLWKALLRVSVDCVDSLPAARDTVDGHECRGQGHNISKKCTFLAEAYQSTVCQWRHLVSANVICSLFNEKLSYRKEIVHLTSLYCMVQKAFQCVEPFGRDRQRSIDGASGCVAWRFAAYFDQDYLRFRLLNTS